MIALDKHKILAKQIVENQDMVEFLTAIFCPDRSKVRGETEQNVLALSDEDYGRAMKTLFLTELHFKSAMETLRALGRSNDLPKTPVAPH